jgi:hypothetical protein
VRRARHAAFAAAALAAGTLAAAALAAGTLAACARADAPARAESAEALVAPWLTARFGAPVESLRDARPALESSGYAAGAKATWLDASRADEILEVEAEAGKIRALTFEWRGDAADAAERSLRARLPAPVECSALAESVEDFKTLLWALPDGASASAMRKGKRWRLTVSKPPADGFAALLESCKARATSTSR